MLTTISGKRYERYRVTVQDKDGNKLVLYIPWSTLEDEVSLFLANCCTVTIDGGVMAKEED